MARNNTKVENITLDGVQYVRINGRDFKVNPETGKPYQTYFLYTDMNGKQALFKGPVDLLLNSNIQLAPPKEKKADTPKVKDELADIKSAIATMADAIAALSKRK